MHIQLYVYHLSSVLASPAYMYIVHHNDNYWMFVSVSIFPPEPSIVFYCHNVFGMQSACTFGLLVYATGSYER